MKSYEPSTPRTAMGLAAVAMTAITMGIFVVLPATFDSAGADPETLAAAPAATRAPIAVASNPARIDVPEIAGRKEYVYPDRATLGPQDIRGSRHKLSSRPTI